MNLNDPYIKENNCYELAIKGDAKSQYQLGEYYYHIYRYSYLKEAVRWY
jgi:hypothetical protein